MDSSVIPMMAMRLVLIAMVIGGAAAVPTPTQQEILIGEMCMDVAGKWNTPALWTDHGNIFQMRQRNC